eukprot:301545_1
MGGVVFVICPAVGGCCVGSGVGIGLAFAGYAIGKASDNVIASWIWFALWLLLGFILCILLCMKCNKKMDEAGEMNETVCKWSLIGGVAPGIIIGFLITHLCLVFTEYGYYAT